MAHNTYAGLPVEQLRETKYDPENYSKAVPEVRPFNPLTDVSADAKYMVKHLVLWFLVLPVLLGILIAGIANASR